MSLRFLNSGYFAGSVGIGEESPSAKLQITTPFASSPSDCIFLFNNGSNTPGGGSEITFGSSTSATPINYNAKIQVLRSALDNGSSDMRFLTTHVATAVFPDTKMIIKSDGNVGIGTTSPAAGLQVAKGGSTIPAAGSSTASAVFGNSTSDDDYGVAIGANSSGVGYISSQRTDGAATTYNLAIQPNGGNAGIGTTAPVAKLDVLGTSGGPTVFDYSYATNAGLRVHGNESAIDVVGSDVGDHGSTILLRNGNEGFGLLNNPNLDALQFKSFTATADAFAIHSTGTNLSSLVDIITLEKTGNVGIGVTGPSYKLDVNGIIRSENSSEVGTLYLGNTAQSQIPGGAIIGQRSPNYSSTGNLLFQVPTWGANTDYGLTTQMSIEVSTSDTKEATISMIPFGGNVLIASALLSNQENTDVDTGAEVVAQVSTSTYTAAFFDFVIKKVGNIRSGTVYACHDGTNVEFTETSTNDLGDTSDVTLSVDISGANMRLLATVTSDDWSVKSLIRAI